MIAKISPAPQFHIKARMIWLDGRLFKEKNPRQYLEYRIAFLDLVIYLFH